MAFYNEMAWLKVGRDIARALQVMAYVKVQELQFKHVGGLSRGETEAKARRLVGMDKPPGDDKLKEATEKAVTELDDLGKDYNLPEARTTNLNKLILDIQIQGR